MKTLQGTYGKDCKVFTDNIEPQALETIQKLLDNPVTEGKPVRIMPDTHDGKRIERGEEKADATLSDSFAERLKSAYKKQEQKDIEREIDSIHFGTKGNGLMDGMLTYKDKEESE